jgi:hypothetical protein
MNDALQAVLAIVGGVITVAIISVIVGQKSQAPEAIQAAGSTLSNIIAAAVNPVTKSASNGNLGANTFSSF